MSTPKPLCRLTEVKDTAEYIGSFLKAPDLAGLCSVSKDTCLIFSKHLCEMALLKAVFDANTEQVKKILGLPRPPKSKCIVLAKTHIKETYFSKKLNKTGCKREWTNISPLEAAAWCGDIFVVRELLLHVPENQKQEAYIQLKGILERKESEQNGAFLAPYRALIKVYEKCYDPTGNFNVEIRQLYLYREWDELNKLWNEIWQIQRSLPTYALQEFCDDKPFAPLPSFTEPPKRSCYLDNDPKQLLDLDDMKFGWSLYKGSWEGGRIVNFERGSSHDLSAIRQLCEVRMRDLQNLIKELEGLKLSEESDYEEDEGINPLCRLHS